jgi:hypothetical protein
MDKEIQSKLKALYAEKKALAVRELVLRKQLADPEKNKRLYEIAKTLYIKVLNTDVDDDLNQKEFIKNVEDSLNEEDSEFFLLHKYDAFHKSVNLFSLHDENENPIQKTLTKGGYIGLRIIKKQETLQQVIKCLADAKIQQHKDILIKELKVLRAKEALRYSLFDQEGFDQIKDLNQRELLLELKSNAESTQKAVIAKLNIPTTTANNWIKNFKKLGLL